MALGCVGQVHGGSRQVSLNGTGIGTLEMWRLTAGGASRQVMLRTGLTVYLHGHDKYKSK